MWVMWCIQDKWCVGYYAPDGHMIVTDEYESKVEAKQTVHFLNGGN